MWARDLWHEPCHLAMGSNHSPRWTGPRNCHGGDRPGTCPGSTAAHTCPRAGQPVHLECRSRGCYLSVMIRYDLICEDGHEFDGWFSDSAAFDKQLRKGLVSCVHCGSTKIEKRLMAPGIPVKGNRKTEAAKPLLASAFDPRQR